MVDKLKRIREGKMMFENLSERLSGVFGKLTKQGTLSENDVNIQIISTSEIKITMVIDKSLVEKAVQVLHEEFELDK